VKVVGSDVRKTATFCVPVEAEVQPSSKVSRLTKGRIGVMVLAVSSDTSNIKSLCRENIDRSPESHSGSIPKTTVLTASRSGVREGSIRMASRSCRARRSNGPKLRTGKSHNGPVDVASRLTSDTFRTGLTDSTSKIESQLIPLQVRQSVEVSSESVVFAGSLEP